MTANVLGQQRQNTHSQSDSITQQNLRDMQAAKVQQKSEIKGPHVNKWTDYCQVSTKFYQQCLLTAILCAIT